MGTTRNFGWSKWISILILLAGGGVGAWWYIQSRNDVATEYQTATVTRGNLTQAVTATGQLGPVVNVQVGSQISGIVKKLFIDWNSIVKSNQIIAEIDPATYEISVLRAKAQLANSKANLTLAEVQARRADDLFKANLISASDHDTAIAQQQQGQAQVQSDEANLKSAEVELSYCTIYAPVDGVVISRNVDVGQTVAASFNTPTVAVIANDLAKMQIDALVSEADIGGVADDQNVNFTVDAYPYRTFHGTVNQIRYGAITNQNVINYDCIIAVSNNDLKLLPGMTANVSIITAERNNALKIPNAALRFRPPDSGSGRTNTAPQPVAPGGRSMAEAGGPGPRGPGAFGPGGGRNPERGPGGGPGGSGRLPRPERQLVRTVYVLSSPADTKKKEAPKLIPTQIKVGISDGSSTEVIDGLDEGAQVVTAILSTSDATRANTPQANPFGGGFRRF